MSGAVHTPVTQADRDAAAYAVATEAQMHLRDAVRRGDHDRSEAVKAFARHRIASQAELLEALEYLHAEMFGPKPDKPRHIIDSMARAAIAKAKGGAA